MAKTVSLFVKFGALVFVLKLQTAYAIQMQLLGGIWITQLFPAVILGCFLRSTSRFSLHPWALFAGWAAGMACGTGMAWSLHLKSSIYPIPHLGGVYAAIPALLLNLAIAAFGTAILCLTPIRPIRDTTDPTAYIL